MNLANKGQVITMPEHDGKDSVFLDFLGYKENHSYTENDLELGIIDQLQDFLLEMGKDLSLQEVKNASVLMGKTTTQALPFHTILR